MTEQTIAAAIATAQPPIVAVEQPAAPKVQTLATDLPPEALAARIQQAKDSARRELLAEFGAVDPAAIKAALEQARATEEAKKSDAQRLAELDLRVKAQSDALGVAVAQTASRITAEQKAAIDAIAGNDPVTWLRTHAALAPTWGQAAASVAPAAPAAPTAAPIITPPVQLATTAPIAPAPAPTNQTSAVDHAAVYASLDGNPFARAAYLERYGSACYPKT